jgi:hypothetical protein
MKFWPELFLLYQVKENPAKSSLSRPFFEISKISPKKKFSTPFPTSNSTYFPHQNFDLKPIANQTHDTTTHISPTAQTDSQKSPSEKNLPRPAKSACRVNFFRARQKILVCPRPLGRNLLRTVFASETRAYMDIRFVISSESFFQRIRASCCN